MTVSFGQVQNNPFYPAYNQGYGANSPIGYDPESIFLQQQFNDIGSRFYNNPGYYVEPAPGQQNPEYVNPNQSNINNPGTVQNPNLQQPAEEEELGMLGGIGRIISAPFKYGWEVLKSGGKFVGNVASGAWKATGGAIGTLLSGHPIDAVCEVFEGVFDVVKAPFQLIGDLASDTVNYLGDIVGGVGNVIEGAWDGVCDFFSGIFS